jgi:hypothetical protein
VLSGGKFGNSFQVLQDDAVLDNPVSFVATVAGNEALFDSRQITAARQARRMQEILGFAPTQDLVSAIRYGTILDTEVTTQDVARSEIIYGQSTHAIAGRTTQSAKPPIQFINGTSEVAPQRLYCDVMTIDGCHHLVAVAKPLNLLIATDLTGIDKAYDSHDLSKAVTQTCENLTNRGFSIDIIYFDGEGKTKTITAPAPVDVSGAGDHVPVAERALRTIEERVTSLRSSLPFRVSGPINRLLIQYVVRCLNLFPSASDMDKRSPRERFTGVKPTLKSFRNLAFGDYCHVSAEISPQQHRATTHRRTVGAIAIAPTFNSRDTWLFISLDTGHIIRRTWWKLLPTPDDVIAKINSFSISAAARSELPPLRQPVLSGGKFGNSFQVLQDDDAEDEDDTPLPANDPPININMRSPHDGHVPTNVEPARPSVPLADTNPSIDSAPSPPISTAEGADDGPDSDQEDEDVVTPVLRRSPRIQQLQLQAHHATLSYLSTTLNYGLMYHCGKPTALTAYVDATELICMTAPVALAFSLLWLVVQFVSDRPNNA